MGGIVLLQMRGYLPVMDALNSDQHIPNFSARYNLVHQLTVLPQQVLTLSIRILDRLAILISESPALEYVVGPSPLRKKHLQKVMS